MGGGCLENAKQILKKYKEVSTVPNVAVKLTQMISKDTCTIEEFENVIKMDPSLVMRLLNIVNSSYFSLKKDIHSVAEALVFVGMENLKNSIVMAALKHIFENASGHAGFSMKKLWLHSAATGLCSQMIAERIFGQKGENPFLCGILHDIGLIVEFQMMPEKLIQACEAFDPEKGQLHEFEQQYLGTDHTRIGALLVSEWKLPEKINQTILEHHSSDNNTPPDSISGIIKVADYMISKIGYPEINGYVPALPQSILNHLHANINEYKLITRELPQALADAKDILELDKG